MMGFDLWFLLVSDPISALLWRGLEALLAVLTGNRQNA